MSEFIPDTLTQMFVTVAFSDERTLLLPRC